MATPNRTITLCLLFLALVYLFAVSLMWSLIGRINHDESQFMASAFLFYSEGLHPYRDFAYFHMPNLVYIYSLFFGTENPLLTARIFTAICGFGICATLIYYGRHLLKGHNQWVRLIVPVALTIIFCHSYIYKIALYHVWNHASSVLLAALAFTVITKWNLDKQDKSYILFAGFTLGMAIGIRLSIAPIIIPFTYLILAQPDLTFTSRKSQFLLFTLAGFIANLPGLYFLFFHFDSFWFGNLTYPQMNTSFYEGIGRQNAMDLPGKFDFFWEKILRRHNEKSILLAMIPALIILLASLQSSKKKYINQSLFGIMTLIFCIIGSVAATPSQRQYYFILFPMAILLTFQLYSLCKHKSLQFILLGIVIALLIISFTTYSPYTMRGRLHGMLLGQETVGIITFNQDIVFLKDRFQASQNRRILTLSPVYPVNAGLDIYPEFATGPFAWKTSHLIDKQLALKQNLPIKENLVSFMIQHSPVGILTGDEKHEDIPLIDAAIQLKYSPEHLPSGNVLWIAPDANN